MPELLQWLGVCRAALAWPAGCRQYRMLLARGKISPMSDPTPLDPDRTAILAEVLAGSVELGRGWAVYLPAEVSEIRGSTPCLLVYDLWDEVEEEAAALGWKPGLPGSSVRQVIENARRQNERLTADELVAAFAYYYRRDAFIDFDAENR